MIATGTLCSRCMRAAGVPGAVESDSPYPRLRTRGRPVASRLEIVEHRIDSGRLPRPPVASPHTPTLLHVDRHGAARHQVGDEFIEMSLLQRLDKHFTVPVVQ